MSAPTDTTAAASGLTLASATSSLATLANETLQGLWRQVTDALQVKAVLLDALPALIDQYGSAAATLAADWYDDYRATADISGRFLAIPAEVGDRGADELVGWGISPLFSAEPDVEAAKTRIEGGLQRRIANVARDTVIDSAIADPAAEGWQRVGVGSCAFCQMLIARGSVYSEKTADFGSHDHCHCSAVPAFGGQPRPVKPYQPTSRRITDADRARVRKYLRTH